MFRVFRIPICVYVHLWTFSVSVWTCLFHIRTKRNFISGYETESFLGFITEHGKTTYDIKKMILDWLKKKELVLKKSRGIGFDNGVSMAGVQNGIKHLSWNINRKAKFVLCSNHNLNLCGVHASAVNASAITFFGVIEKLYTFFSSSNHKWKVLSLHLKAMMKRLLTIHWSARYEAIRPVKTEF